MELIIDTAIQQHFISWQCRIRQHAMRTAEGRPSKGMRPQVYSVSGEQVLENMTVLILPKTPDEDLAFFRHQIRKTHDPKIFHEQGLNYLQSTFYHDPERFSGDLTALFDSRSRIAKVLLKAGECLLEFEQFSQRYKLICDVRGLTLDDAHHQLTLWHNRLFNPHVCNDAHILAFSPKWQSAQADPSP